MSGKIPYVRDHAHIRRSNSQQMEEYHHWHAQNGRGDWEIRMCPRGLEHLLHYAADELIGKINVVPPLPGETHDDKRKIVFVSARF